MKNKLLEKIEKLQRKIESDEVIYKSQDTRIVELNRDKMYLEKELKQLYETFNIISSITKEANTKVLCETRKNDIKNFVYIKEEEEK
jgi:ABC-type lipoprotein export system ATPase subunit